MKLVSLFLIIAVLQIHAADSAEQSWLPKQLYHTFANKTTNLANFFRQKSQNLKKFYVENVRNKIKYYFGIGNETMTKDAEMTTTAPVTTESSNKIRKKRIYKDEPESDNTIYTSDNSQIVWEDPSIHMTTPQLIVLHGYPAESHTVVTDDGYILTLHRIPHAKGKKTDDSIKTVLLHHGLLGSSADWVLMGPGHSLAYILSDNGYDVWMANVRGNTYSRSHVNKSISSYEFWNFTWHDVSQHDLPAVIDYIMEIKGWDVKINYVGHSMGTTVLFALLSTKTQYNKILRAGFALAPVAFMTDVRSPLKYLAKIANQVDYLMKLLGANEFLPQSAVLRWLSKFMCDWDRFGAAICENVIFIICGYDYKQFNQTMLPLLLAHLPAGASTKTVIHYAQEVRNGGKFQQFDYGPEGNIREYGTILPPEYPVHEITLPIALFSGENDWLAGDSDVTNLFVQLAHPIKHYIVPYPDFNHLDFLFAKDAPKLVYTKLLQLLEEGVSHPLKFDDLDKEIDVIKK